MANFRETRDKRDRPERELKLTLTLPGSVAVGVRQCSAIFITDLSFISSAEGDSE